MKIFQGGMSVGAKSFSKGEKSFDILVRIYYGFNTLQLYNSTLGVQIELVLKLKM